MANFLLFPGLGADRRLFYEQLNVVDSVTCPDFISPQVGESLSDYARRYAGHLEDLNPTHLGGMSFGGMLALELAQYLSVEGVFLISSFRDHHAISDQFRTQARLAQNMPDPILRFSLKEIGARMFLSRENIKNEHFKLLQQMSEEIDLQFFRWAAKASAEWVFEKKLSAPVFQIHGRKDYVAPVEQGGIDVILDDGKHLIQYTHSSAVNDSLKKFVSSS